MVIPHCINYNLDQHQPAVVKSNQAIEKQTADNFYGWETELKPPGPILKVQSKKWKNLTFTLAATNQKEPG